MHLKVLLVWLALVSAAGLLRSTPPARSLPKDEVDSKLRTLGGSGNPSAALPAPSGARPHGVVSDGKRRQLVVARYSEDVSWLESLPRGIDVITYQSKDPGSPHFVDNFGNEASKYLRYIIDRYDDLPDFVAFVQAGRQDWHDPLPKDQALARWDWESPVRNNGMAYLPTSAPCSIENSGEGGEDEDLHASQMHAVREAWPEVFREELGLLPKRWVTQCCAQFEVTRAAVRQHPKSFYQGLFDWVMRHDKRLFDQRAAGKSSHDSKRRDAGHVLEATWVLIFSQPMSAVVLPS